jgi:hypothetical protein
MITDASGRLLVDFLGYFETLAADFQRVCQRLDLLVVLPHVNQTRHQDYRSYYSARTRKLIAQHFAADVELGNYTFDGLRT